MKIIVDAFGGDHAPLEILKGAMQAVDTYDVDIILTAERQKFAAEQRRTACSCDAPALWTLPR